MPFSDANGVMWTETDGVGGWQLTTDAMSNGFDLQTDYLYYLYDDQGPTWDFGGPEGAMRGSLAVAVVAEPGSGAILGFVLACSLFRRRRAACA